MKGWFSRIERRKIQSSFGNKAADNPRFPSPCSLRSLPSPGGRGKNRLSHWERQDAERHPSEGRKHCQPSFGGLLVFLGVMLLSVPSALADDPTLWQITQLGPLTKPIPGSHDSARLTTQNNYKRVREARKHQAQSINRLFHRAGLAYPPKGLFLRAFKQEDILELWVEDRKQGWRKLKEYHICSKSGGLGPKRRQGDGQVPEGVYHIDRYNPVSSFHLSLGLNYPNRSDRILGQKPLGGDIFLHGSCVTIGCLPLEDKWIEELYLIAIDTTKAKPGKITVHLFPCRMTDAIWPKLKEAAKNDPDLLAFWQNLRTIYQAFERSKEPPEVRINAQGRYVLQD